MPVLWLGRTFDASTPGVTVRTVLALLYFGASRGSSGDKHSFNRKVEYAYRDSNRV
jgi:hypothetical protein